MCMFDPSYPKLVKRPVECYVIRKVLNNEIDDTTVYESPFYNGYKGWVIGNREVNRTCSLIGLFIRRLFGFPNDHCIFHTYERREDAFEELATHQFFNKEKNRERVYVVLKAIGEGIQINGTGVNCRVKHLGFTKLTLIQEIVELKKV